MAKRSVAQRSRRAGLLAALFAERGVTDLVRREVDALTPGNPGWELVRAKPVTGYRILLMALVLITVGAVTMLPSYTVPDPEQCTFPSGAVVDGDCMFEDTFSSTLDTDVWNAEDNWNGPLQAVDPDVSCFRHENVTVSGGNLVLSMTANARASCPQTWDGSGSHYQTLYGASGSSGHWPTGQATSYDVGVVSMKTFRMKYGHVYMTITLPPGRGPGGDVTLWGTGCQKSAGVIDALSDLFTLASGRTCDWPNAGSREMDIIQSSRTASTTTINTSHYVASSPGSPASMGNFFGTLYYGARAAQPATVGFDAWGSLAAVTNPTTSPHVYELDWSATRWMIFADGNMVTMQQPSPNWISDDSMFMMLWNAATVPVTPADLPSQMLVGEVRIWCPPGYGCEWSGAGAL